jgi:hypothetical protein
MLTIHWPKDKQPNQKGAKDLNRYFCNEDMQTTNKSVINSEGNANPNHNEIPITPLPLGLQ